jgi:hypothetical protein
MTATVTELLPPHEITVRGLSREERLERLEALAGRHVTEAAVDAWELSVLGSALACPTLTPAEADAAWADYLAEYERWAGWAADDPDFRSLPGFYEEEMTAALNDLLDGTSTYHGSRA